MSATGSELGSVQTTASLDNVSISNNLTPQGTAIVRAGATLPPATACSGRSRSSPRPSGRRTPAWSI